MANFWILDSEWMVREKVVKPALHGGWFLAPTTGQRLEYTKYLHVWGKAKVGMPVELKNAFQKLDVCSSPFSLLYHAGYDTHIKSRL